jgi:hypothetical protein
MKTFSVLHIVLLLLLLVVYQCTHAQDIFVSSKGDTLRGEVKQISFGAEKKVQITTADKKKTSFSIFQTRSFTDKEETYIPVKGYKGYVFMKVRKSGYLSLLGFQQENQTSYDGLYLLKKDGTGIEVPGLTFKKTMTRFLSECPDVTARIEGGDLNRKNLEQMIDEFNTCINSRTAAHDKVVARYTEQSKKMSAWDVLEEKVKAKQDFTGKQDALEMITDIKGKIQRNEKIPNFLLEGLKSSLAEANLPQELENALKEVNQ